MPRKSRKRSSDDGFGIPEGIDLPPGFSFSWKRALGITRLKQRIARKTGIPTTRQGRQAKLGRMLGCQTLGLLLALPGLLWWLAG